jgi:hypothetical protein
MKTGYRPARIAQRRTRDTNAGDLGEILRASDETVRRFLEEHEIDRARRAERMSGRGTPQPVGDQVRKSAES